MNVTIERVSEGLLKKIIPFYKTAYDSENRIFNSEYLPWLLYKNPHGEGVSVNIKLNGEIISNMFLIPINMIKNGGDRKGYYVVDVLSHPLHRDKNLFVKMIRVTVEKIKSERAILIGHPNSNALPGWRRTKMNFMPPLQSYLTKPNWKLTIKNIKANRELVSSSTIGKEIDNIIGNSRNLIINADAQFINWRYIDHPCKKYKVTFVYKNNSMIGLKVSFKYMGFIDRIVHYLVESGCEKEVLSSQIAPQIISFSGAVGVKEYNDAFFKNNIGGKINFFFTDSASESDVGDFITFAASDN
ncbi:TPA: GNAT family N-acetyltransferase [Citrobacter freundii]|uniref:GNAT family N-acetyltransferase n=1 Tax=Citrobacter freundii TaxID=546 RepID=UPI0025619DE9|nr:GNAT family N-acetyltransferase [Citrobacter freundii]MDK5875313.1 GNAT family N-acetyltransferase [Citrobacter freundii]MEB2755141.1 GNAT family N-acetyltransferase [Citrobacter freundii]HCR3764250.1 GNAT family N-acetyltransferase [Citrobacter freundii]